MLIASPRHTDQDLALWREYEAADLIHRVPEARVARSIADIQSWEGGWVSCSWGKDSVVMLHLMVIARRSWPVVWVRFSDRDNPDSERVRDAFLARFAIDYHERVFDYQEVRAMDLHWKAVQREFGARRMLGLRASESGKRMLSVAVSGVRTRHVLRPLAWWTNQDVFAWIAQHGLPAHPAYAMLGGGRWPRQHLRTHSLAGSTGTGMGRAEWEREYYGDVLARIQEAQRQGATHEPDR